MDRNLKKKLLLRKFSSFEYMEECRRNFRAALDSLEDALTYFENHYDKSTWGAWHASEWPSTWRERAQKNLENLHDSLKAGIDKYQLGDPDQIRGSCNGITALAKDMEGMGNHWWKYIPAEYQHQFTENRRAATIRAANIRRTVGQYWDENDDDLLDEEITGPIDEQDLLRYLKPGESV